MKKRTLRTVLVAGGLSALLTILLVALTLRPVALEGSAVDLVQVEDGEYLGFYQNKILFAAVRAQVRAHRLLQVEVLWHKESYLHQARQFADALVEAQGLDADAVSGATLASDTVRMATENALLQGMP